MILALLVQYNYNDSVSIAEPIGSQYFDYYEVSNGKTFEEAKVKALKYYEGTEYILRFIDEEGDEV